VAEEFKLQSGVFVRVSSLRVEALGSASPLLRDLVITGADRAYVGALAWLNEAACRDVARQPQASLRELAAHPTVREAIVRGLRAHNAKHPGSSTRIRRLWLLEAPPSLGGGETSDKGYINQRKVLETRRAEVESLYAGTPSPHFIEID
jgi:feruloyl-CoA synthase